MKLNVIIITYFLLKERKHLMPNLKLNYNNMDTENIIYESWKQQQKSNYAIINNNIEEYLPLISTPAINLYIFYLIHSNNKNGTSYFSTDSISRKLKVSKKTINNWNAQLQDAGLIARKRIYNSNSITQLLPLSNFIITANLNYSEITEDLKNFGYKKDSNLIFNINILSQTKKEGYATSYEIWKRTYQLQKTRSKVTRYIFLANSNNQNINNCNITNNSKDFLWTINNNILTIIWNTHNPKEINNNSILDILNQLRTTEAQKEFQNKYPRI